MVSGDGNELSFVAYHCHSECCGFRIVSEQRGGARRKSSRHVQLQIVPCNSLLYLKSAAERYGFSVDDNGGVSNDIHNHI